MLVPSTEMCRPIHSTTSHRGETDGKQQNIVGINPHKRTLSAAIVDERGGIIGVEHFKVSGNGHRALEAWALIFGPVVRWGIEGATGLGRHTTMYLTGRDHDVRDACPNRTAAAGRGRHQGKSDTLDCERIARETLAHADVPVAFKRAGGDHGPEQTNELLALWHKARRSLVKSRQHLLNEAESLLQELPDDLRGALPDTDAVRPRLAAVKRSGARLACHAATTLRLTLLERYRVDILELDRRERERLGHTERRRAARRSRRSTPFHGRGLRALQRHRTTSGVVRRRTWRTCAAPSQPRRES